MAKSITALEAELAKLAAKQKAELAKKKAELARAQRFADEKLGRRVRETGATPEQIDAVVKKLAADVAAEKAKQEAEKKAAEEAEKKAKEDAGKTADDKAAKLVEKAPAKPAPKPVELKPAAPKSNMFGQYSH